MGFPTKCERCLAVESGGGLDNLENEQTKNRGKKKPLNNEVKVVEGEEGGEGSH